MRAFQRAENRNTEVEGFCAKSIAKRFVAGYTQGSSAMKARSFIVRALLFAVVLAPSAIRTYARQLGVPSCRVAKSQSHPSRAKVATSSSLNQFVAFMPGHHAPAPRLHRIRGKKIIIERGLEQTPPKYASTHFLISDAPSGQQEMDGPNPSRGPPSQFSL